jgi:hypothetical protein
LSEKPPCTAERAPPQRQLKTYELALLCSGKAKAKPILKGIDKRKEIIKKPFYDKR